MNSQKTRLNRVACYFALHLNMKVLSSGIALASAAALLLAPGTASISGSNSCSDVADPDKVDCGFSGIDQSGCEAKMLLGTLAR